MKLQSDKYKTGEKALTRKEYDKLISCIDNLQDELLIKLAVSAGFRREDVCQIKIGNIDLDNGILTFHESKKDSYEYSGTQIINGKKTKIKKLDSNGHEIHIEKWRSIHLNPDVLLLIKKYLKTQDKRERLFTFTGRTAYNRLNHWCRIAGIPERPFHSLRATCVKFSQAAGWSPEQVSKLTGDTISVIQEHYSTPSDGEMKDVVREKPII